MSRKSEYTIDLVIQDDQTKDSIRSLEKGLKEVGKIAKKSGDNIDIAQNLNDAQKAADDMISQLHKLAKNTDLDFNAIIKAYAKNSKKAISELERQYARHQDQLTESKTKYTDLQRQIDVYKSKLESTAVSDKERATISKQIVAIEKKQRDLGIEKLEGHIRHNRQIRANLKSAEQSAKIEAATAKQNAKYEKLEALKAKRRATTDKAERKALKEKIRLQKAHIKSIEKAEKAQKAAAKATQDVVNKTSKLQKLFRGIQKGTQLAYNATGLIGGAGRTAKAAVSAGVGMAQVLGAGVSAVVQGADDEVARERQAARIKGYNDKDRENILRELYIRTGADYSVIVDAINRVQGTLGGASKLSSGELIAATAIELRYPGTSHAFASTSTEASTSAFQIYANRMKAIQRATGASSEQIQASAQLLANMKSSSFQNAKTTELQAVYLGLQNSGAFDSQEELDIAFKGFVRGQARSRLDVFEYAQKHDWKNRVRGQQNRVQAENTLRNIDWGAISVAAQKTDSNEMKLSAAENMSMKMRKLEYAKNQLLLKLIPAVLPVVDALANLLSGEGAKQLVKGIGDIFMTVAPLLEPVFKLLNVVLKFLNEYILSNLKMLIEKLIDWIGGWVGGDNNQTPILQNANGGVAFMPSVVGERGPEAIIPLDYSRRQRASNIATHINQTFNMGHNETTTLSLANAVRSRDFSRAMTENAFFTRRRGEF